jgi:hypothetical protein
MVNIDIMVDVKLNETTSIWNLRILNNENLTFLAIKFPVIQGIGPLGTEAKDDYLVYPAYSGALIKDFTHTIALGGILGPPLYPSQHRNMQFMSIYSEKEGNGLLYYATDIQGYVKNFEVSRWHEYPTIILEHTYYPAIEESNIVAIPYPIVFQLFKGDWKTAAKIYKAWSDKQWWAVPVKNRLGNRKIPVLMVDVNTDTTSPGEIASVTHYVSSKVDYPFMVCWWGWEKNGWYINYPDVFPPKTGWNMYKEIIDNMKSSGAMINVLFPGSIYSMNATGWVEAKKYAIQQANMPEADPGAFENRSYFTTKYLSTTYAAMDPSSEYFRRILENVTKTLGSIGGDVFWVDGVVNQYPLLSYKANTDHPAGGGDWWFNATTNLLAGIKTGAIQNNENASFISIT